MASIKWRFASRSLTAAAGAAAAGVAAAGAAAALEVASLGAAREKVTGSGSARAAPREAA